MLRQVGCVLILIGFLPLHSAVAQESHTWVCSLDKVTGFIFKDGNWVSTDFAANSKFIIRGIETKRSRGTIYQLRSAESENWSACDVDDEYVSCPFPTEVLFDTRTLRFLWSYRAGYIDGRDDNQNSPAIGIGTCAPA